MKVTYRMISGFKQKMSDRRKAVSSVFIKSLAVIDSCKTIQQLNTAHKYLGTAYLRRFISTDDYGVLTKRLYESMPHKAIEDDL